MLKIFDRVKDFEDRCNFVDDNNVVVGYETSQKCCEYCNHYFTENFPPNVDDDVLKGDDLRRTLSDEICKDLSFDPNFFMEDNGGIAHNAFYVVFRLVQRSPGSPKFWYLVLYNLHNGYYGHGFDMTIGDKKHREGGI